MWRRRTQRVSPTVRRVGERKRKPPLGALLALLLELLQPLLLLRGLERGVHGQPEHRARANTRLSVCV